MTAKHLGDVVELLANNQDRLSPELFSELHPRIRKEPERLRKKISGRSRCGRFRR